MTTANRPTWNPAKGGGDVQSGTQRSAVTRAFSAKDIPGFTTLKTRQPGQNSSSDIRSRDLKRDLEEREQKYFSAKEKARKRDYSDDFGDDRDDRKRIKDRDDDGREPISKKGLDADDTDESDNDSSGSDSDNDEDDTAELMRELERIKKEREEEAARQEREKRVQEKQQREREIVHGNPLLAKGAVETDFTVKKKWFEDTVFKNQSRGEVKVERRFINDTIRNDFHRKFLQKYIQ